jgi:hypothetical protein
MAEHLGEVRRCLKRARISADVEELIVVFLHDSNPIRSPNRRERELLECYGCARLTDRAQRPFMTYHVMKARTVLTGDMCPDQTWCVELGHRSWHDCHLHRHGISLYRQGAWLGDDYAEDGVWLCGSRCVKRLCAFPTWRAILNIELVVNKAEIHIRDYERWKNGLFTFVATCREFHNPGSSVSRGRPWRYAGEGRPWRYEHLNPAMQVLAIEAIASSIAGGWGQYWNMCEAFQWDHRPNDHIGRDWPAGYPDVDTTAPLTPPLAIPDP